jgi:hypothetical protein
VGLPTIGSTAEAKLPFYRCETSEDLRIVELVRQDDELGAARYAQPRCIDLKEGCKGIIEDTSHWSMRCGFVVVGR